MSAKELPPILLLYGGRSAEAEVSVVSGSAIAAALLGRGAAVTQLLIARDGSASLLPAGHLRGERPAAAYTAAGAASELGASPPRDLAELLREQHLAAPGVVAIPALHGPGDEDGAVQALLAAAGVNYVGAEPAAAALGMDKPRFKDLAASIGVAVLPHIVVSAAEWQALGGRERTSAAIEQFARSAAPDGALMGKPAAHGSSIGMKIARTPTEWAAAVDLALEYGDRALLEPYLERPRELEVALLERRDGSVEAYGPGEVFPGHDFYDYEAKYAPGVSRTSTEPALDATLRNELLAAARRLFVASGGRGLARLDFLAPRDGSGWFMSEVNTFPGFTPISLYPKLVEAAGISFADLCALLVETAVARPVKSQR